MKQLHRRCEEALVDLLNTRVRIIDAPDQEVIGHHGVITGVEWDRHAAGPLFLVQCDGGHEHTAQASDLADERYYVERSTDSDRFVVRDRHHPANIVAVRARRRAAEREAALLNGAQALRRSL